MAHYITSGHRSPNFGHRVRLRWPDEGNGGIQRMVHHASPFEEPMYTWLIERSRMGFFDVTSGPDAITYWFTNPDTALEFQMRFR